MFSLHTCVRPFWEPLLRHYVCSVLLLAAVVSPALHGHTCLGISYPKNLFICLCCCRVSTWDVLPPPHKVFQQFQRSSRHQSCDAHLSRISSQCSRLGFSHPFVSPPRSILCIVLYFAQFFVLFRTIFCFFYLLLLPPGISFLVEQTRLVFAVF